MAGRQGAGRILRELSRSNILVEAVDRCEQTFRVHPLLRGLLLGELRRGGRERERRTHLRAATWLEAGGDLEPAAEHAAAAGDVERAGRLLWDNAPMALMQGRGSRLEGALQRFTPARVIADPALALCTAASGLARRDRDYVEHWTDVGERALERAGSGEAARFAAGIAVLRATVARDGLAQMGADARRARGLAAGQVAWRALACFLDGAARHLCGETGPARERLAEGARVGAMGAPVAETLCHGQLALIELSAESWQDGVQRAELARECVEAYGLDEHPASALPYAVSAFARAHEGRVEEARLCLSDAGRLLRAPVPFAPWFGAEIDVALARAQLRLSDSAAARDLLTSAGRLARHCPEATELRAAIDDAWARADSFAETAVVGVTALTTAELRVLRMLPSHMSLREIATRLHVSLNTVKSQAHAVYRKLDVSSRSEAVARARTVGARRPVSGAATASAVTTIRVAVAVGRVLARRALRDALAGAGGLEVIADCGDVDELRAAIALHQPEVVITDIRMPPTMTDEGVRVAAELRVTHPAVAVILLSSRLRARVRGRPSARRHGPARLSAQGAAG